jgi:hypothetical protein
MPPWQKELIAQVRAYLRQYAGVFYADHGDPTFHQISRLGDQLTYLAEHYVYNFAQSGSDWADHYFVRGSATLVSGCLGAHTFALVRHVHLTEWDSNHYSPSAITSLMIAGKDDQVDGAIAEARLRTTDPEPAY